MIRVGYSIGGHKAMVNALASAFSDENFAPQKNEVILINSLPLSEKSIKYLRGKLGDDKFDSVTSHVININCVYDHVSPMCEKPFGKTFYFDIKNGFRDGHNIHSLDFDRQVQVNRSYLFQKYFYESIRRSQKLLGEGNAYKLIHANFMLVERKGEIKHDIYGNELKIQPFKIAISLVVLAKSYVSAYFKSMSVGRRVLFGLGAVVSVGAVVLACAKVLAIGFLLAFPPVALIASAVALGCIGLGAMISSFVKINWKEPVPEDEIKTKKIDQPEIDEPRSEREEEQNRENEQMKNSLDPDKNTGKTNGTFIQQSLQKANVNKSKNDEVSKENDTEQKQQSQENL